ncbi:NAD(P)H-dependent oxidoreductase [Helicobacter sp.]|uniref:NAD(P)H-dependent oxidoreductase n=1 Tax=Helicobacter sp. TaxID=218 RepID=UPI002A74F753|nr:NAD(P)H-dependent oxidoreductase [Helicobacter sp.]MDY2584621.1 NAD(P)H-dependent oxidoreductase [Helicobacter sp.]
MDAFLESVHFRHACKLFDRDKKIPQEVLNAILEVGRLAPSSFGMEPTRMVVFQSEEAKESLQTLCWNQPQIATASAVVVYKVLCQDLNPPSAYLAKLASRKAPSKESLDGLFNVLKQHLKTRGYLENNIFQWGAMQAYIMATYMVAYASYLKIDTCYMEDFDKAGIESYLHLDATKEQVALVVCFGYRAKAQQERFRLGLDEIVEYK